MEILNQKQPACGLKGCHCLSLAMYCHCQSQAGGQIKLHRAKTSWDQVQTAGRYARKPTKALLTLWHNSGALDSVEASVHH